MVSFTSILYFFLRSSIIAGDRSLQIRSGIRSLLKLKISAAAARSTPCAALLHVIHTGSRRFAVVRLAIAATHVDELPLHTLLGVVVEKAPTSVGRNNLLGQHPCYYCIFIWYIK